MGTSRPRLQRYHLGVCVSFAPVHLTARRTHYSATPLPMDLHTTNANILRLSGELDALGDELKAMAQEMNDLKAEIYNHEVIQHDDIRSKEKDGKLTLKSGNDIKLTDTIRLNLTHFGKREQCAKYEGLKRKRDVLKIAVEAKRGALSGYQSAGNSLHDEMKLEGYST